VLMDLHMPHMDGFEAARIIGNSYGNLPIIALSAAVTKDDLERTTALGMKAHLSKPINREILYEVLGKWLFSEGVRSVVSEIAEWPGELPKDLPGFDLALGLARFDGDGEAYRSALEDFFESLAGDYGSVPLFLERQEIKKAEEVLHILKGVAGTLGAVELQGASQAMEKVLKKNGEVPLEMRENFQKTLVQVLETGKRLPPRKEKILEMNENQGKEALETLRNCLEKSEFVEEELLQKALISLSERAEKRDVDKFRKLVRSFHMEEALALLKNLLPLKGGDV
ncbi:MAG TPA: response regulator, partial [Synergistaceae bacterium]|nr:response regulator [Synergistaceae bacterium]